MERPIFIIFSYTTDTNFSKPLCLLLGLCQNPYHVDCIYTLIPSYFRHIFSFYLVLVLSYFDKNIQVSQDIWLSLFQIFPLTSPFLFKKKKTCFHYGTLCGKASELLYSWEYLTMPSYLNDNLFGDKYYFPSLKYFPLMLWTHYPIIVLYIHIL